MTNEKQEVVYHTNPWKVLLGILVGGIAGAVSMLLLAPQSGKETRDQIQNKGIELRDRTSEIVDDTMVQVRSSVSKITDKGREKIKELKQHGQDLVVGQLDKISETAQVGKKALQSS